jgi:hypothetical protein
VSLELLEAEPWTCRVDLGGAPSASALPAHPGGLCPLAWLRPMSGRRSREVLEPSSGLAAEG